MQYLNAVHKMQYCYTVHKMQYLSEYSTYIAPARQGPAFELVVIEIRPRLRHGRCCHSQDAEQESVPHLKNEKNNR